MIGDQALYRSSGWHALACSGRGALYSLEAGLVTDRGVYTSEDADISNDKAVKSWPAVNPRFPGQRFSSQG
jgi:hypothetical protein